MASNAGVMVHSIGFGRSTPKVTHHVACIPNTRVFRLQGLSSCCSSASTEILVAKSSNYSFEQFSVDGQCKSNLLREPTHKFCIWDTVVITVNTTSAAYWR